MFVKIKKMESMMKTTILMLLMFLILSCEKQNQNLDKALEKLNAESVVLKRKNDSLVLALEKVNMSKNYWFDVDFEGIELIKKGINNPELYIENSLRENPSLIPLAPTLGGNMMFENIQILSKEWLIADYSDGHISGKAIYSFKINGNNKVEYKVLNSVVLE
jgi:hypothetical protein